jgi:hypothetical protein
MDNTRLRKKGKASASEKLTRPHWVMMLISEKVRDDVHGVDVSRNDVGRPAEG